MTNEPEAAAYHEQQQSGDDEAQSERKDGTYGTKRYTWTVSKRHSTKDIVECQSDSTSRGMSDLSQVLDVLP